MPAMQRGEAEFTGADGKRYHLVLDFAAMADAEEAADMGTEELLRAITPVLDPKTGEVVKPPRIKHMGALMYGALQDRHPGTSLRDAIRIMGSSEAAGEALGRALTGAMPKPDPSAEGKGRAARGTGTKPRPTGRAKG